MMLNAIRAILWISGALCFAAVTHFTAVLILPKVATRDAYDRLSTLGSRDRMTVIPTNVAGDSLPTFRDLATVQAVCFFDLSKVSARVKTRVEDGRLLTLSFRTREGRIFYAITDRAAFKNIIDIRLLSESQFAELETGDEDDRRLAPELRLKALDPRGMVIATALVARASERDDAEESLRRIECGPETTTAK